LKEEQEILKKQQKFVNILPLQSKSQEKGPPFSFPIYYSSSSHKSSLISKLERTFEEKKNKKHCKETLRRYNF
jgi:hypothetical protein